MNPFFLEDIAQDPDNYPNFAGTSAAAPHVAGLAALLLQAAPAATPDGIREALNSTAIDMESAGFDDLTGYGFVDAVEAADYITDHFPHFDANDDPAAGDQADDGVPDQFTLTLYQGSLYLTINGSQLTGVPLANIDGLSVAGSSDVDTMTLGSLGTSNVHVVMQGGGGDADIAYLYDTVNDDKFRAWPHYTILECDVPDQDEDTLPDAYTARAKDFYAVHTYASWGGNDVAYLKGSAGNDEYLSEVGYAKIYNAGTPITWLNRAKYFGTVYIDGAGGQQDVAFLYDSTGDDTYYGNHEYGLLTRTVGTGANYYATAFHAIHVYATEGGFDTAELVGSTADDESIRRYDYVNLYNDDYFHRAKHFERMSVSGGGGSDAAWLFDSALDDLLSADDNWAQIGNSNWLAKVLDFATVHATSENGGDDDTDITTPLDFTLNLYGPWDQ